MCCPAREAGNDHGKTWRDGFIHVEFPGNRVDPATFRYSQHTGCSGLRPGKPQIIRAQHSTLKCFLRASAVIFQSQVANNAQRLYELADIRFRIRNDESAQINNFLFSPFLFSPKTSLFETSQVYMFCVVNQCGEGKGLWWVAKKPGVAKTNAPSYPSLSLRRCVDSQIKYSERIIPASYWLFYCNPARENKPTEERLINMGAKNFFAVKENYAILSVAVILDKVASAVRAATEAGSQYRGNSSPDALYTFGAAAAVHLKERNK